MECAHPELREWLMMTQSDVWVKYPQYRDGIIENKNLFTKRRNLSRDLPQTLHFTPMHTPMMHASQAYDHAVRPEKGADAGYRKSMINEVVELVRWLEENVGTDLATYTTHSHLWYTGCERLLRDDGSLRSTQPWKYVMRVADGRSVGEGLATAESWDHYTERYMKENMFYM